MRHALAIALTAALAAPSVPAQTPSPSPAAPRLPVFGTDVDVVAVDVNVVDGKGQPLRGLTPQEFTLSVDGTPRRVLSADFVSLGETETAPPAAEAKVPAEFSSNEGARTGRTVVVVVDQGSIRRGAGRLVIRSVDHLLDRLQPEDLVGLVTMPGGGPQVELTHEHARVRNALTLISGRAEFRGRRVSLSEALSYDEGRAFDWDSVVQRECGQLAQASIEYQACETDVEGDATSLAANFNHQADLSVKGLELLMESLQQVEGAKTVVLVSEGLRANGPDRLRHLSNRAAAARVAFFGVMVDESAMPDITADRAPTTLSQDNDLITRDLYRLASLTRGEVFRTTGSPAVFERIAREISGYYLIGFEPQASDRDGKEHTIKVEVGRKGATVRARRSLPLTTTTASSAKGGKEAILASLRSPVPALELPVRVATYVLQDPQVAAKVRLVVSAEIGRGATSAAGLSVGFALLDEKGKIAASSLQDASDETATSTPAGAVPFVASVPVEPGVYLLKLAAVDSRGRRGSVQHRVTAALTTVGPVSVGDLMLGPPATKPGTALRPAVETRAEGGVLAGYVELYGGQDLQHATVTMDVAATPSGASLLAAPTTLSPPAGARRVAQGLVPVSLLPAGRYVARATLTVAGRPTAQVVRSFTVAPSAATAGASTPLAGYVPVSARFDRTPLFQADALGPAVEPLRGETAASPTLAKALELAARGELAALGDGLVGAEREGVALAFLRGLGFFARNQLPAAIAQFRAAVRARPDFLPAVVYLGAALAAGGQDREAVGAWNMALLQEAGTPLVPLMLADAFLRLGEPAQAADVLKEAGPEDPRVAGRLGMAYALSGHVPEALPLLESHLGRHPEDVDALFALVRLLYEPLRRGAPTAAPEKERFLRHARAYVAARASHSALVAEWVRAAEKVGG
jgi:VWFA-related protein